MTAWMQARPWPTHLSIVGAAASILSACLLGVATGATASVLPLIAIASLACVITFLVRPHWATVVWVSALYLNVPAVAVAFYGVPQIVAAGSVALLGIPLLAALLDRQPLRLGTAFPLLLVFTGVAMAATMASARPQVSWPWIEVLLLEGVLLYVLLINVVRRENQLRSVLWAIVLAGGAMGGISLIQDVSGAYDHDFGGFGRITSRGLVVGQDVLGEDIRQPRLSGPIGEQNRYAQVLLVLLPLAVFLARTARGRRRQVLAIACGVLILAGALLTFSRGGALAIVAMAPIAIAVGLLSWRHVLVVLVVGALAAVAVAPTSLERVGTLRDLETLTDRPQESDGSLSGRAALNLAALRVWAEHPIIGVGPGMFAAEYSARYANESGVRRFASTSRYPAHNLYLGVAAELGTAGLLALVAFIGATLRGLWVQRQRWRRTTPTASLLASALMVSLVGYLVSAIFLHLSYDRYFWFLIALATAATLVLGQRESVRSGERG